MSRAADHASKDVRKACESCRDRKARFQYRGRVRADRHHTLCFECFRSERDRQRARRLTNASPGSPLRARCGAPPTSLDAQRRAHREQMLAHLAGARR